MNPQRPFSKEDRTGVHVWLPTETYHALRGLAAVSGVSMNGIIVQAMEIVLRNAGRST